MHADGWRQVPSATYLAAWVAMVVVVSPPVARAPPARARCGSVPTRDLAHDMACEMDVRVRDIVTCCVGEGGGVSCEMRSKCVCDSIQVGAWCHVQTDIWRGQMAGRDGRVC